MPPALLSPTSMVGCYDGEVVCVLSCGDGSVQHLNLGLPDYLRSPALSIVVSKRDLRSFLLAQY